MYTVPEWLIYARELLRNIGYKSEYCFSHRLKGLPFLTVLFYIVYI